MNTLKLLLLIIPLQVIFNSCGNKSIEYPTEIPPREEWTTVSLPEGADTTSERWKNIDLEPKPPVMPKSPQDQASLFLLPEGYKMEPVLTEPQIQQPGAISFDANGRMYVLELRTYMLTVDSEGTLEPVSGISRWEDRNDDGVYETGGMFVDSLVFPRFVLPFGPDGVLTMESNEDEVYLFKDTDGDGKADKKELFTDNFGRPGNVEHQQAFLYWGMDNWMYSTVNPFRIRWTPDGVIREPTGSNHAQWGITHDDDGKLWFQGGASGVPSYFQFPIHYGDYIVKENFTEGFEVPYGAPIKIADMQGGMSAVRQPDGNLNRVTGAAGNDVFRGDRLPAELRGEYFYGEPVARIVRQITEKKDGGLSLLHNVYQDRESEFIRSMDPLFRPVDMTTSPDGTMYITDMYHGIIQEGEWVPEGSYLRTKVQQYQLDKVVSLGRIWRLTHEDFERDLTAPKMYERSSQELVEFLGHPNGWWRDMAQKVLVLRQDKSIAAELERIVIESDDLLHRFHALWTLEGIGSLTTDIVTSLFDDPNPRMRKMALWASESLYKAGKKELADDYIQLIGDTDTEVAMRAMMTCRLFEITAAHEVIKGKMAADSTPGIQLVGKQVLEPPVVYAYFGRGNLDLNEEEEELVLKGADIYNSLCYTCHGTDGNGTPIGDDLMAPPLVGNSRVRMHPEYVISLLLYGMTGDIEGNSYAGGVMAPMGSNDDEWIASAASFVRTHFENEGSVIFPDEVKEIREKYGERAPFTYSELIAAVPKVLEFEESWVVTASHTASTRKGSTTSPAGAFNFEGWTTGETQSAGMWYQIEFPETKKVTELNFVSPAVSRGWREGSPPPLPTYPYKYNLTYSLDGNEWSTLIENGTCSDEDVRMKFEAVDARFIKIELTESQERVEGERWGEPHTYEVPWRMREFQIYGWENKPG